MTNQEIVDYVINTPNNTNPVILKQMLKDIAGSGNLQLDTTLSIAGKAADAKAVGDAISKLSGGNADRGYDFIVEVDASVNEDTEYSFELISGDFTLAKEKIENGELVTVLVCEYEHGDGFYARNNCVVYPDLIEYAGEAPLLSIDRPEYCFVILSDNTVVLD